MSQQCTDVKSFFDIRSWEQRLHWSDAYLIFDVVDVGADDVDDNDDATWLEKRVSDLRIGCI